MTDTNGETDSELLSEVEKLLKKQFDKNTADRHRTPSVARDAEASARHDQLVLVDQMRPKMPFTQDKYLVKENPHLVAWERETRKFLRNLVPKHGHRVSAVMVYEWATGLRVADVVAAGGTCTPDLRKINQCLRYYFGKSYSTWIMGRKVPNCYKVRPGYYIKRHRPMTLTLYSEYLEKTLNP